MASRKRPRAVAFKAWDIVKLKGYTGRYRVYFHPRGWVFACLDADCMATSEQAEVAEVLNTGR